jgi:plastocyanin
MHRIGFSCLVLGLLVMPPAARSSDGASVTIDNFEFSPSVITVGLGTNVTWTNKDAVGHSIVLTTLASRSPTIGKDQQFSYKFNQTGTYAYICGVHSYMKGQVVVK